MEKESAPVVAAPTAEEKAEKAKLEEEKRKKRGERFGVPAKEEAEVKKAEDPLKKRAERFGLEKKEEGKVDKVSEMFLHGSGVGWAGWD